MNLSRRLAQLLRPRPASESRQALWRIALAVLLAPALAIGAALTPGSPELDRAAAVALAGLLFSIAWFALLGGQGSASSGRRLAAMLCDVTVLGAVMAVGGAWTAPLYLLLVAATLDHGLRFGSRPLPGAAAAAVVAMLGVVVASAWWRAARAGR